MISRRVGERILIGKDIEITVTEIHRRTVRLSVKSSSQKVLRGELLDAIEAANQLAAQSTLDGDGLGTLAKAELVPDSPKPEGPPR